MRLRTGQSGQRRGGRRGAAAVEFALILPLLVLLVLGCVDFGRFAHTYISVTNAARAGAGEAAITHYTPAAQALWEAHIRKVVKEEIQQMPAFSDKDLKVTSTTLANKLDRQVEVSHPFQTLVSWPLIPSKMNVQRTVVIRLYR